MSSVLFKDFFKEIKNTFNRFISIFAIVALGVGLFAGLKVTSRVMKKSADAYYDSMDFYDLRLVSTVGFTRDDVDALREYAELSEVDATHTTDALFDAEAGRFALRVFETGAGSIDGFLVTDGRLPEKDGECAVDARLSGKIKLGDKIDLSAENTQTVSDALTPKAFTVTGYVRSPVYISFERGNTNIGNGSLDGFVCVPSSSFDSEYYFEIVALVGPSGEGKTTLMRVVMGELEPISGESRIGHNVSIGYFAQNQEDVLDKSLTVFETIDRIAVGDIRTKVRDLLAQFLFRGEDIDKRVSVLSGGERARLGMAKLMLQNHNLLALDEPTNHMDIKSKDILKQALKEYDGTLLIVSHDRDFLDGLVTKFYEFDSGVVKEHLETVQEFLQKRKIESLQELDRKTAAAAPAPAAKAPARTNEGKKAALSYEQQKELSRQEKKKKDRLKYLEAEIEKQEKRMKEIEEVLSNPPADCDIMELTREYLECKRDLDAKTDEWGSLL